MALCQKCYRSGSYPYKFKSSKVPAHAYPPADWEQALQAREDASTAVPDDEDGDVDMEAAAAGDERVGKLLSEKRNLEEEIEKLEHEDVIGNLDTGFIPTRFSYNETPLAKVPDMYKKMGVKEILKKTDKELNSILSLKKISRPYWDTSNYTDERTQKYEVMKSREKKEKRTQQKKTGVHKDRLDAYKTKNVLKK